MKQLSDNWQQCAVAEFFDHLNWLGLVAADTPPREPTPLRWQTLRVSEFWQQVNWLGLASTAPPATTSPTEWPRYRVKDFFGRMNWQGIGGMPPVSGAITAETATVVPIAAAWPTWSVDTFFGQLNWEGHANPAVALEAGGSLWRLSVAEFCTGLPWRGQPVIAHISKPASEPPPPPAEPEFTLSDLSSLF